MLGQIGTRARLGVGEWGQIAGGGGRWEQGQDWRLGGSGQMGSMGQIRRLVPGKSGRLRVESDGMEEGTRLGSQRSCKGGYPYLRWGTQHGWDVR